MGDIPISKDNHYVSQAYLAPWEFSDGKIYLYQILVSHENVPLWVEKSIKGIGYRQYLYTRQFSDARGDEIEHWFSHEFESPAKSSIQKVINADRLTPDDWYKLVRFLALHDVRTPARLIEHMKIYTEHIENSLEGVLMKLPEELERKQGIGGAFQAEGKNAALPIKISTEIREGEDFGTLKVETAAGRASWLWSIQHHLNNTAKILHRHKWTIMHPARGMSWFTTDKPVIRLNYYSPGKYDFKGGWGNPGSEILMPLSPEHMLYTRVGDRPPVRGSRFSIDQTLLIRRLMAEHAHRFLFGKTKDDDVTKYRKRFANAELYKQEEDQWKSWHTAQTESEEYLFTREKG